MSAPTPPPANTPLPAESPFPASAQWTLAVILGSVLLLVGWRGWNDRNGIRPTEIQPYRTDLNRASRSELQQLPGIGPQRADTLLAYRDANGFPNADDLKKVKGIGVKKQNQLRPWVQVAEESPAIDESQHLTRKPAMTPMDSGPTVRYQKPIPETKINLNEATITELQKVPGIGPVMSGRIVEARNRKAFERVEDLRRVGGIGAKTLEKLRPYVTIGE